jgi:hypothetical protein
MPGNWDGLGLGGIGRVDMRGETPPIGNTGPGGMEGMGLMALLRRLSMGMDDRETELPKPSSPDPLAERSMAMMLGIPGVSEADSMAMSPEAMPMMDTRGGISPTARDMAATGQQLMPLGGMADQGMGMPPAPMPPGGVPMGGGGMDPGMGMGMPPAPMPPGGGMGPGMDPGMGPDMGGGGMADLTPEMMRQMYEAEMQRLRGTGVNY